MIERLAIRKGALAIRNATLFVGVVVVVVLLVIGVRTAGREVLPAFAAFVGLSALCLFFALHTLKVKRRAESDLWQLHRELDHRVEQRTAEVQQASERYIATLDHLLAGCQLISFEWRYLYVNDALVRHGRKSRDELIGRTMMECYPDIESTPMFAVLNRCMLSRTSHYIDNEFRFPDGSMGWFEISVHPAPEGIFVVSIDVSDRKRAEVAVKQQLARLQSLRAIDLAILGTTDLALSLKTVLDEAKARLHADAGYIHLFEADTRVLSLASRVGELGTGDENPIRLGEGVTGRAAIERRTVSEPAPRGGVVFAAPLIAKGALAGVLSLSFSDTVEPDADWMEFFETVAGQGAMAIDAAKMFQEAQRSMQNLHDAYDTTIEGWSRALDLRDKETEGHTQRVTEMTVRLARMAGFSEAELVHIKRGALLHDIGKMGVPDHILLKPDKLTDEEWVHMKKHPTFAYELLKPIEYLRDALDIPYCHHEKWDGSGYPRGMKGEEIPLAARLFAVVDIWDAIRSDRPYRQGWDEARSLDYIRSVSGTHLDPAVVDLFLRVVADSAAPRSEALFVDL